jgi:predicted dithiol-disulfide oxidoreductase (DUF899 family)
MMTDHKVVGRQQWQAARDELLKREKAHTRMGDELAALRGRVAMMKPNWWRHGQRATSSPRRCCVRCDRVPTARLPS